MGQHLQRLCQPCRPLLLLHAVLCASMKLESSAQLQGRHDGAISSFQWPPRDGGRNVSNTKVRLCNLHGSPKGSRCGNLAGVACAERLV
eukprot:s178_g50.t1